MNNSGLNMEIVKDHNRALIIQLICTNNGVTRQDLTEATNLTSMTLTNITSELIKNNLICEIDAKNTGKGRTPKLLYPAPNSPVAAGIFISKTCCRKLNPQPEPILKALQDLMAFQFRTVIHEPLKDLFPVLIQ